MAASSATAPAVTRAPTRKATRRGPVVAAVGWTDATEILRAASRIPSSGTRRVLSVLERLPNYVDAGGATLLPADFEATRVETRRGSLGGQVTSASLKAEDWTTQVLEGETAKTIAQYAREEKASLIVMGIGRHRPLDRILGVETTVRTIRHADVPVLAVCHASSGRFARIVVATDFDAGSAVAATTILPLLPDVKEVHLVHVFQPMGLHDARLTALDDAYARGLPEKFRALHELIGLPEAITIIDVVRRGRPAEQLLDYTTAIGADLIVAGRRAAHSRVHTTVGNVATALLRGAACSIAVAPPPAFPDADRARRLLTGTSESRRPEEWVIQLQEFTKRNAGRRATVEIDDASFGAQVLESGYALRGAAYDPRDKCVAIMLDDARSAMAHVTRVIGGIDSVAVATDARGRDIALRIVHGPGQTILTFHAE